ncbi:hypothetical protein DFAR_1100022 [Desulfarculales bacterium]
MAHWPWSPEMWAAGDPPTCAGPPAGCTHPSIKSSGSPPHRTPSWNFTGKSVSSSKGTPPASPGPSSPSSSENRSWRSPKTAKKPGLIIDEAYLLRLQVLAELHIITQF